MNKLIIYSVTVIVTLGILTSCSNESNKDHLQEQNETQFIGANASQNQQVENDDSFQTGVFVDFDALDDPLYTEEIKSLMKTTLEALANKDEQALRRIYYREDSEGISEYFFDRDYSFESLEGITKDHDRLIVRVKTKARMESEVFERSEDYWLVKDKSGQWKLGAID
ncbi:MAG: hypothetical protein E7L01_04240 [Paenibacillus macerans]|uniref:Putative lipoprotein n=1 Tax=Paenibacillus macerans TaxID=44252 RepID=A0A090YJ09_PAEMA|nr:hypothetical protein [Paenibacillus macerans]KFM98459.1 putative lipoprotein [Paenibacillus macerans]MBS5910640.1 hypothetical protein [Paenibacillus macerans]MCY7560498.1 hypothetical protein [Paenibacillus macerans]MDU7472558.1 hypothetical protein [Paenibacillus macerans]MEC0138563.1 hypothetical protein [Paenibacillus macerans]